MYALIVEERTVQSYYLIDTGRPSTLRELAAREVIRRSVVERFPETGNRLLPSIIQLVSDIAPNDAVTAQFERLRARVHAGIQYEWLARFAHERGLDDVELCIVGHRDESPDHFQSLMPGSIQGTGHDCRLRPELLDGDLALFSRFRFPVLHLTKVEIGHLARQHGFDDILQLVWSCHNPTRDGQPCGKCPPCESVLEENPLREMPRKALVGRGLRRARNAARKLKQFVTSKLQPQTLETTSPPGRQG
jgi:hypothetical protein